MNVDLPLFHANLEAKFFLVGRIIFVYYVSFRINDDNLVFFLHHFSFLFILLLHLQRENVLTPVPTLILIYVFLFQFEFRCTLDKRRNNKFLFKIVAIMLCWTLNKEKQLSFLIQFLCIENIRYRKYITTNFIQKINC